MRMRPSRNLVAVLAVGAAVFGGAQAGLAWSGVRDPRVLAAGMLTAALLTTALLLMSWARRRASGDAGTEASRRRVGGSPEPSGTGLVVVDLGQGQAAVIFSEPGEGTDPGPRRPAPRLSPARETEMAVEAICDAVAAAAATPPGRGAGSAGLRRRLGFGRSRGPRSGPGPDSG